MPGQTMRMSELAATISASLSLLSHIASRLEARGYLTRRSCPGPGRATNATLTDTGYAKVVAGPPGHVQTVRDVLIEALPPGGQRSLAAIGDRAHDRLGPNRTWHFPQQCRQLRSQLAAYSVPRPDRGGSKEAPCG